MLKTYRFKLYHAKRNKKLKKAINIAGCIYNHCIALHKRYYRLLGKKLNMYALQKHITKLKKLAKYQFWNQLGSQAIQEITERIEKGYKLFFDNRKRKVKSAPPSFKKVKKYRSFTLKQAGFKFLDGNRVVIMGQEYKFFKSREIEGKIKTLTVKRDALGDIYICVSCDLEPNQVLPRTGESVGYDFGLKMFLKSANGDDIEAPLFFQQNANAIKKANRKLSRKKKGSTNRKRARLELARLHKKVANCRMDFHFKTARNICDKYATICLEDLNIKAMQRMWGQKISDLGHSQFVNILKYQSTKFGSAVVEIPRFYPSSKTCFDCGYINQELQLKDREWTCPECSVWHDRDLNAAKNILRVGASTLKADRCGDRLQIACGRLLVG